MRKRIYKLFFKDSLHLGQEGIGLERSEEIIHSDTLFSAIVWKWIKLYGEETVNSLFKKVKISSAFPFTSEEYFFPRPALRFNLTESEDDHKKFKKIKYITKEVFERIINGEREIDLEREGLKLLHNETFISTGASREVVYKKIEIPRVILDRITNRSNIFYFEEYRFNEGNGLFFIADVDKEIEKEFESALRLLGDEGIGGDRSSGKGLFEIQKDEIEIREPEGGTYFTILSLYYPAEEEFNNKELFKGSSYELIMRGGWLWNTPIRRKRIRMFKEGAVFFYIKDGVYGKLVKLFEKGEKIKTETGEIEIEHDVYRYGYAYTIKVKRGKE